MKRFFGSFMLLSLLVLAACSDTTPEITAPGDAGTGLASFRFDIDPSEEQVGVTALPGGLQTQDFGRLDPQTQLVLEYARYIFGANNTLTIEAIFTNVTTGSDFSQPFEFLPALLPSQGNYRSSTEPQVTDEDLGGDGVLSPGETTTLTFTVKHKGERFSYSVEAFADVEQSTTVGCGADGAFEGDVTIRTQADINVLRGCTTLDGTFLINTDAQSLDFSPLDGLRVITRDFVVAPPGARFIGDVSAGEVNPNLTAISGFDNLRSAGRFIVTNNTSLTSVSGFGQLEVLENFAIGRNPALTSVTGFGNLVFASQFTIFFNDSLPSISGFGQLEEVSSIGFSIGGNPALTSIAGFGNLESVAAFFISGNASLVSVMGFENLTNVERSSGVINNTVFDCSIPPQSNLPFLPVDESTGNLVNCPTK